MGCGRKSRLACGKDAKSKPVRQHESDVCGRDSIMRWCGKIETRSRCEQSQSPRDNARHRPIPKGLRPSAQGWRVSAYLGSSSNKPSTATRLRQFFAGRSCDVSHNPVGVVISFRRFPRVARTSQPWALGQNPVRILWATKISLLTELVGCAFGNGNNSVVAEVRRCGRPQWWPSVKTRIGRNRVAVEARVC